MAEKIVVLVACLLCAVPFLIIGIFEKNSKEPITFWSGDKTLKFRNLLPDFVRLWDCDACFGLHGRGLSDVSKL